MSDAVRTSDTNPVVALDHEFADAKFALLSATAMLRNGTPLPVPDLLRWRSEVFELLAVLADAKFALGQHFERHQ